MRAEKAVYYLLVNASAVTAKLGAGANSVYPGQAPQNTLLPCLVIEAISGAPIQTIDASSAFGLAQSRIQVTAIAAGLTGNGYEQVKDLLEQVRLAVDLQRGVFNTVRVVSILRDSIGPDLRDDDRGLFSQSIDFQVTYQEP